MKLKKKNIAIIIALIIVIAGGIFAYLYFCTDMFKTPEDLFYEYIGKAAKTEEKYDYQDFLEELRKTQTKSFEGKATVGIELDSKKSSDKNQQATYALVNGLKLNLETKSNPNEKKEEYNIGIEYNGADITEIGLVKDDEIYGVKSEFLDDKYVAVENNNLKDLMRKLGASTTGIPDKIEPLDMYELLYISKEDQDKIVNTYKDILKNSIPSENYKKVENVIQKVNGVDTNTTVYALSINEKEFYNIMLKVLETAKNDDLTLNLIVDKVNSYIDSMPSLQTYQTYSNKTINLTKEDLTDAIEDLIEELNDELENADESSTAEIVVYVSDGKTVRIETKVDNEIASAIDFYTENDKEHIVLYARENNYSKYSSYSYRNTTSSELSKVMEIEYKTSKNQDEENAEIALIIYDDEEEVSKITFEGTTKGKVGEGQNQNSYKFKVETDELSVGFTIDSEIEYTDSVEIEGLNSKNSTILNDMSRTELNKFFENVSKNAQKALQDKMEDFGLTNSLNSRNSTSSFLY